MISISRRLGCRPEFANMSGTIDLARLEDVAASIARSVISQEISRTDSLAVMEHPGSARVTIEGLAAHTETLLRYDENRDVEELPKRSVLEWVGEAKKTGMFEWFFTAQDIKMEDGEGNRFRWIGWLGI
jgi:hybrid polyketide synthase/nonribosomal peptide synthetase ACE1